MKNFESIVSAELSKHDLSEQSAERTLSNIAAALADIENGTEV